MKKINLIGLIAIAILLFVVLNGNTDTLQKSVESLRGIKSMSVRVTLNNKHYGKIVNPDTLKTDIELKLRMAGIKIEPFENASLFGSLICSIDLLKNDSLNKSLETEIVIHRADISFYQLISLERNHNIKGVSPTWVDTSFGISGKEQFEEGLRKSIQESIDIFLNDYLSVNPKQ